jgi:hypothetical protein
MRILFSDLCARRRRSARLDLSLGRVMIGSGFNPAPTSCASVARPLGSHKNVRLGTVCLYPRRRRIGKASARPAVFSRRYILNDAERQDLTFQINEFL